MVTGLKLNDVPTACPSSFDELNGRVFQRIFSHWDLKRPLLERDYFKLFCIIADRPFVDIVRTPENEAAMEALTAWVVETQPDFKPVISISINGRTIPIPQNIGSPYQNFHSPPHTMGLNERRGRV